MAAEVAKAVIQAHPLAGNPDKCFGEEEKNGRFKKLQKIEASKLFNEEKQANTVRFVCISDTHNMTDKLPDKIPEGDVLLHSGDFTKTSAEDEIIHFNEFLGKLKSKFEHILVIAGNHELSFDEGTWNRGGFRIAAFKSFFGRNPLSGGIPPDQAKSLLTNCTYIEDETVELYGIKIYGSPCTPSHHDLAFNATRGEHILNTWNKIPEDTDILLTHGPPLGIGDLIKSGYRVGCSELLATLLDRVQPKYHIFGHIHEDYGIWKYNGDKKYRCVQKPIV